MKLYKIVDFYEKAEWESPEIIGYYGSYEDAKKALRDYRKECDDECNAEIHYCL